MVGIAARIEALERDEQARWLRIVDEYQTGWNLDRATAERVAGAFYAAYAETDPLTDDGRTCARLVAPAIAQALDEDVDYILPQCLTIFAECCRQWRANHP